ncbi:hypothetical protein ABZZ74_51815 [Streptomyces sp. NPDC006476]|uniref:hypothetical protein n=1 Tax=Streptomyces sp. NPDC006476 TaxID=3157175 RepID=UPI0033AE173D
MARGEVVPDLPTVQAIVDLVERAAGVPLTEQARTHVITVYLSALEETDPQLHETYRLEEENRQLTAENERLKRQQTDNPDHTVPDGAAPQETDTELDEQLAPDHPALALRTEVVEHVHDVARAGVTLPAQLLEPQTIETSSVIGVLEDISGTLQGVHQALKTAIATGEHNLARHDAEPAPTTAAPVPPRTAPPPRPDGLDLPRRGQHVGWATGTLLTVAVLVLAYLYLVPLLKKGQQDDHSGSAPSNTPTASSPLPDRTNTTPGLTPTANPTESQPTHPAGRQSTPGGGGSSSQRKTSPSVSDSQTDTSKNTGPILGGRSVSVSPRSDSADCSKPIVFTFSAAAQKPGTIEYTWHPDDRLIARGVQDKTGSMTFTATNEQHDQYSIQLTGTQPGDRIQGGMTVQVTSPQADAGVNGDQFDITCT